MTRRERQNEQANDIIRRFASRTRQWSIRAAWHLAITAHDSPAAVQMALNKLDMQTRHTILAPLSTVETEMREAST